MRHTGCAMCMKCLAPLPAVVTDVRPVWVLARCYRVTPQGKSGGVDGADVKQPKGTGPWNVSVAGVDHSFRRPTFAGDAHRGRTRADLLKLDFFRGR